MTEPQKDTILYFEDEEDFREAAKENLEEAFPKHRTIVQEGGCRYGNAKGCVDEVLSQIESVDRIAMVCTDGNLAGFVTGWDVVEELRKR